MYVDDDGRVFVEIFHPTYPKVRQFLISCCEPHCRTSHVNEYAITPSSLAAAASEGIFSEEDIRRVLLRYARPGYQCPSTPSAGTATCPDGDGEGEGGGGRKRSRQDDEENVARTGGGGEEKGWVPPKVEKLLAESANENRLRILLQKKQHTQHETGTAGSHTFGTSSSLLSRGKNQQKPSPLRGRGQGQGPGQGQQLAYYLASTNRLLLDKIIAHSVAIREALVPLRSGTGGAELGGRQGSGGEGRAAHQWIFSDLERYETAVIGDAEQRSGDGDGSTRNGGPSPFGSGVVAGRSNFQGTRLVYKAEIKFGGLRQLRREIQTNLGLHIDVSYDHLSDTLTARVPNLSLKPTTRLRPYQEASLERFQASGRVRNGVVVLPCGAGKTLTGIAASAVLGRPVIVMCINVQSVLQWRDQFLLWSQLKPEQITICTSDEKQVPRDVFITTYKMLTYDASVRTGSTPAAERSWRSLENEKKKKEIFDTIRNKSWGLLILDEVHTAPAEGFQRVVDRVTAHCVLGLTATLLREDRKIEDLRFLVGPKLFEANWLELAQAGHLATVQCAEVRCPLPIAYLRRYTSCGPDERSSRTDIECMNPVKLWCTQALIRFHSETRTPSDKIIIFCDSRIAIKYYAHKLGVPFMDGATGNDERNNLLEHFRRNPKVNVILISRVGDTALDLPEANVVIQVHGLGASRRQEAQRLGRILRPKPPTMDSASAFFYTLVSLDTDEENFMFSRQQWLRAQGFAYRVLHSKEVLDWYWSGGVDTGTTSSSAAPKLASVCVGPPRWSLLAHHNVREALLAGGWHPGNHHHHQHTEWLPFDAQTCQEIERCFLRGRRTVTIRTPNNKTAVVEFHGPDGGHDHSMSHHHHSLGVLELETQQEEKESERRETTDADAPSPPIRTVGTAIRRMHHLGVDHVCDSLCVEYALSFMGIREQPSMATSGTTPKTSKTIGIGTVGKRASKRKA